MIYWTISQGNPARLDELNPAGFLSPEEQARLAELRFIKRRREWLLGRWTAKLLLQQALGDRLAVSLQNFSVENEPRGAPFFASPQGERLPFTLSISHRGERAFCALSTYPEQRLGVDIERIEARATAFLEDYFTPQERSYAARLEEPRRDAWVTLAWSLKEAVLKALGEGLRVDPRRVELLCVEPAWQFDPSPQAWQPVGIGGMHPGITGLAGFWQRSGEDVLTAVFSVEGEPAPGLRDAVPPHAGKQPHLQRQASDLLPQLVFCPIPAP